ncbi:MAG: DUF2927 domain-containing protein [Pseudomonadota bacterium]
MRTNLWTSVGFGAVIMGMVGCVPFGTESLDAASVPPTAPPQRLSAPQQSELSAELERYYARIETELVGQGLLRQAGGGPDTPFGPNDLAENFVQVALFDEYSQTAGELVANQTASRLRRWEGPIRMRVIHGPSVPARQRAIDVENIESYGARLSDLTSVPISLENANPNFFVLILNEDERRDFGPRLERLVPGIAPQAVRTITTMPRSIFCLVFAFSEADGPASYTAAIAVIRAEHPELLRLSCIHEELAQAMGLANDSPGARPSIFNDDEEFALLTRHDELLLRILYDPRLETGMTEPQARPIATTIADEFFAVEG